MDVLSVGHMCALHMTKQVEYKGFLSLMVCQLRLLHQLAHSHPPLLHPNKQCQPQVWEKDKKVHLKPQRNEPTTNWPISHHSQQSTTAILRYSLLRSAVEWSRGRLNLG